MTMLAIHEGLALALLYTCFCRAIKTDENTAGPVLFAFWLLGVAATVAIFAPLAWDWRPDVVSLSLLGSILVLQIVTALYWRDGIPPQFQKGCPHA